MMLKPLLYSSIAMFPIFALAQTMPGYQQAPVPYGYQGQQPDMGEAAPYGQPMNGGGSNAPYYEEGYDNAPSYDQSYYQQQPMQYDSYGNDPYADPYNNNMVNSAQGYSDDAYSQAPMVTPSSANMPQQQAYNNAYGESEPAGYGGQDSDLGYNVSNAGNFYIGAYGELLMPDNSNYPGGSVEFEENYGVGVALGYNVTNAIRGELELGYREMTIDKFIEYNNTVIEVDDDEDLYTAMVNAYYDFHNESPYSPYLGAGVGVAYQDYYGESEFQFAYQGMAGVNFRLSNVDTIYVGYRYMATNKFDDMSDIKYQNHILQAGYRMDFGPRGR